MSLHICQWCGVSHPEYEVCPCKRAEMSQSAELPQTTGVSESSGLPLVSVGGGVRSAILNTIVKLAMTGASGWQEICKQSMESLNITVEEVEAEVRKRRGQVDLP